MDSGKIRIEQLRLARQEIYDSGHTHTQSGKRVHAFPVGLTRPSGEALRDMIAEGSPKKTLEVGFALGLSTSFILEGHMLAGTAAEGCHTVIDPFQRSDWGNAGIALIERSGCRGLIEFVEADSGIALPALVAEQRRFDWAFVDGGHLFEHVFVDLYYAHRLLAPGSRIVVDDWWMPAVRAAAAYFHENWGTRVERDGESESMRRFAVLTVPESAQRPWDHFVAFGGEV